jgi:glycosyltransferase involved in cell wall biosynthesis
LEKVLFISYQFPPKGGPGVHRSINLVKHLPDYGYLPIVLTTDRESLIKGKYNIDDSLIESIPIDTKIIRTPSYEPNKLVEFFMKIKIYRVIWAIFYPLLWEWSVIWAIKNYRTAKKIIEDNEIKLVYTSSGPFSSMLLGWRLKKKLDIIWVADLRDPFSDAYAWQFPTKFHWYLMRKFERILFSKPDKLVVNTDEVKKLYIKRRYLDEKNIQVINNGY